MRHSFQVAAVVSVAAVALTLTGCTDGFLSPDRSDPASVSDTEHALGRQDRVVATPFRARFITDLSGLASDPECGTEPTVFRNTQEDLVGLGRATHLGRFRSHITFCVDVSDLSDGELSDGESIPYWDGVGTFTAANGDELWIAVAGEIVPSTDPAFDFEFADPFTFVGGTGRFEGATGGGVTDSLVDFGAEPSRTYHRWTGTLIRQPGI